MFLKLLKLNWCVAWIIFGGYMPMTPPFDHHHRSWFCSPVAVLIPKSMLVKFLEYLSIVLLVLPHCIVYPCKMETNPPWSMPVTTQCVLTIVSFLVQFVNSQVLLGKLVTQMLHVWRMVYLSAFGWICWGKCWWTSTMEHMGFRHSVIKSYQISLLCLW